MKLVDYTKEATFLAGVQCADRDHVVSTLVDALVAANGLDDAAALTEEVLRREEEGSTAIGQGLAIPHARHAGTDSIHLAVATLASPLPADPHADDDQPIDVVILLVGPRDDPRQMLRALARLTRLVRGGSLLPALRAAADPAGMRDAFEREERRFLA